MDSPSLCHPPPVSTDSAAGLDGGAVGTGVTSIGGVLWTTTQRLAWRPHVNRENGAPLFESPPCVRAPLALGATAAPFRTAIDLGARLARIATTEPARRGHR